MLGTPHDTRLARTHTRPRSLAQFPERFSCLLYPSHAIQPATSNMAVKYGTIFLVSRVAGYTAVACLLISQANQHISWHPNTCPGREKLGDSCLLWVHATEAHLTACARCSPVNYNLLGNSLELFTGLDDRKSLQEARIFKIFFDGKNHGFLQFFPLN